MYDLTKEQVNILRIFGIVPGMDAQDIRRKCLQHNGETWRLGANTATAYIDHIVINGVRFMPTDLRRAMLPYMT